MRYYATLSGAREPVTLDVESLSAGRYAVTLRGERHEVDACALAGGGWSLLWGESAYSVEFDGTAEVTRLQVHNQSFRVQVVDERTFRLRAARSTFALEGAQTLTSPMPGKVVKVLVKVGEEVREGQGLVVVEAMKMENELKSPKAGKITQLWAKEGTTVEQNAPLAVVD